MSVRVFSYRSYWEVFLLHLVLRCAVNFPQTNLVFVCLILARQPPQ